MKKEEDEKRDLKISNEQIAEYLKYYVSLESEPNYAILVNGAWGSGKTWFINEFREKIGTERFLYVSLYGLTSISEIADQLFCQLHPALASKPFNVGAKVIRGLGNLALKQFGLDVEIPKLDLKKFLSDAESKILIFDDLERCKIGNEEVLGYINGFVEHQGQKVIILANEKEITCSAEYNKKKEKLIGRTFTLSADIQKALPTFIKEVSSEPAKKALNKNLNSIIEINDKADSQNLRTLRYCVLEYQRLFSILPKKAQEHEEFQEDCIRNFFALAIQVRSGKLAPAEIEGLSKCFYQRIGNEAAEKKKNKKHERVENQENYLADLFEKYFDGSSQAIVPNDIFWRYFFELGSIPSDFANESVESCKYFFNENTPIWMRFLGIWDTKDDDFKKYFDEVKKSFSNHKFTKQGEVKHVAAALIYMSKRGIIDMTLSETVKFVNKVVSEMEKKNLIEMLGEQEESFPGFNAYGGICFFEPEAPEFQKLSARLKEYQVRRASEAVQTAAPTLLELMQTDPLQLLQDMTIGNYASKYAQIPILRYVSVKDFLRIYVEMAPGNRKYISHLFQERYKFTHTLPALTEELPWLKKFGSEAKRAIKKQKYLTKFHLDQLEKTGITPAIAQVENFIKTQNPSGPAV